MKEAASIELASKDLPDGRRATVLNMIFNHRLVVGDPETWTYDAAWCFRKDGSALRALSSWDGSGEPEGWMKNLQTGELRES